MGLLTQVVGIMKGFYVQAWMWKSSRLISASLSSAQVISSLMDKRRPGRVLHSDVRQGWNIFWTGWRSPPRRWTKDRQLFLLLGIGQV